jgi:hypothetical protein
MLAAGRRSSKAGAWSPAALLAADILLFAVGLFLAYLNMLVAMAYDFGLLSCLVLGEALGYGSVQAALLVWSIPGSNSRERKEEEDCCS